ncbi:MAG: hypothetical protein RLP44_20275 [Aggregatilineales bacterium]
MGRDGEKLYDSDETFDFFYEVVDLIEREISFRLAPERVFHNTTWLREVINIVEVMLLFDVHNVGTTVYMGRLAPSIKRLRDTFFNVWDGDWSQDEGGDAHAPFRDYQYRVKHRHVISSWFDRLDEIATYWSADDSDDLALFVPIADLPYFRYTNHLGKERIIAGAIMGAIHGLMLKTIVFNLSDENLEPTIRFWEIEHVWVAVDVINTLCEAFGDAPSIREETIDRWFNRMKFSWMTFFSQESRVLDEDRELYQTVVALFDRLKRLAKSDSFYSI